MAASRRICVGEDQYAAALMLERRMLRAVLVRLLRYELPYDRIKRICYDSTLELVRSPAAAPAEQPGFEVLIDEALESTHTLIDEMIEQSERRQ